MTLNEFVGLSYQDLKKLDTDTLKKLVSEKGKSLNKRIRRIEKNPAELSQVSVATVKRSGGYFGIRGKNRKELLAEAKREQRFAKGKASTVSKAKAFKEKMQRAGGGMTSKEYGKKKRKEYIEHEKKLQTKKTGRTKKSKKSLTEKADLVEKKSRQEYDKKVTEYWENFNRWKEENPTIGSPTNVKNNVSYRAFKSPEEQWSRFTRLAARDAEKRENQYISTTGSDWASVEESDTPFNPDVTREIVPPTEKEIKEIEELINKTGGLPLF